MNLSKITNPQAKFFAEQFFKHASINRELYNRIPEAKYDFKMTPRSDPPRKTISHIIANQRAHLDAVTSGALVYGKTYDDLTNFKNISKEELLAKLKAEDERLIDILSKSENIAKTVKVPWGKNGELIETKALTMLWGLNEHEILHTGWNIALMDHIGIERFPALKRMWG